MTDQIAGLEKRQFTERKAILLRLLFTRSRTFSRPRLFGPSFSSRAFSVGPGQTTSCVALDHLGSPPGVRPASFVGRVFPAITWQPMKRKTWLMIFSFLAGGVSHRPPSLPFCRTFVLLSVGRAIRPVLAVIDSPLSASQQARRVNEGSGCQELTVPLSHLSRVSRLLSRRHLHLAVMLHLVAIHSLQQVTWSHCLQKSSPDAVLPVIQISIISNRRFSKFGHLIFYQT